MLRVVKLNFRDSLLPLNPDRNFVIKISRDRLPTNLRNRIRRDTVTLHRQNPIVNRQFLIFFKNFLQFFLLSDISCQPPLILQLNNLVEALILLELPEQLRQILLMILEQLQKPGHLQQIPPKNHPKNFTIYFFSTTQTLSSANFCNSTLPRCSTAKNRRK